MGVKQSVLSERQIFPMKGAKGSASGCMCPSHQWNTFEYIPSTPSPKRRLLMAAYIIAKIDITDWEQYQKYIAATPAVIEKFGGTFIARGGETLTLEGPEETRRVVLLEFPSLEKAKAFYTSQEYQDVLKLREGAATASLVAVEGV